MYPEELALSILENSVQLSQDGLNGLAGRAVAGRTVNLPGRRARPSFFTRYLNLHACPSFTKLQNLFD